MTHNANLDRAALIETTLREAREQILDLANARWSECEATEQELVGHIDEALDALAKGGACMTEAEALDIAAKAELEAFKREVSDKAAEAISIAMKADTAQALFDVDDYKVCAERLRAILSSFILPKPEPLVELSGAIGVHRISLEQALAKHGLKLERIEHE